MTTTRRVRDLVRERDITLHRLSILAGLNYSTLLTTERRRGEYSMDTIYRICAALDISVAEFFDAWR